MCGALSLSLSLSLPPPSLSPQGSSQPKAFKRKISVPELVPGLASPPLSPQSLIPDIKPPAGGQEVVVDLHADDSRISEDEAERHPEEPPHEKALKICRTVTQVVPAEGQENGQGEEEEEEKGREEEAPEPLQVAVETVLPPPAEHEVKKGEGGGRWGAVHVGGFCTLSERCVSLTLSSQLDFHRGLLAERPVEARGPALVEEAGPGPVGAGPLRGERESARRPEASVREQWAEREREMERRERTRAEREWDRDKVREGPRSRSRSRERRRKERPKSKEKKKKAQEEPPAKLLDDLFRKTKAAPCIYWLPLTDTQVPGGGWPVASRNKETELVLYPPCVVLVGGGL
uniref:Apoptotic chromatin condensation inducer 1 n=1 Tax=Sphenodon punctatus TaxID=8508 RepID=A0A8D0L0T0_SPHPU